MTSPIRIQLRRTKGWRMPENTMSVARPGKWGNHWRVWRDDDQWMCTRNVCEHHEVNSKAEGIAMAVAEHAKEMRASVKSYGGATALLELRGKNLACFCSLSEPCHADVLLELANVDQVTA